jgi:alpha,alpha-trehalose phosphorylase
VYDIRLRSDRNGGKMEKVTFTNEQLLVEESLFSVANGYVGIRGNFEEGYPDTYETIRGSYINGVYEIVNLTYAENAFGFPNTAQKMVNVMDAQGIYVYFDEEAFSLFEGTIMHYERKLDTQLGYTVRNIHWKSPKGHEIQIHIKKMASFKVLELVIWDYEIVSINFEGEIRIVSTLNGSVENYTGKGEVHDPRVNASHSKLVNFQEATVSEISLKDYSWLQAQQTLNTPRADITIVATMSHSLPMKYEQQEKLTSAEYRCQMNPKSNVRFTKYVAYSDSRRTTMPKELSQKVIEDALVKGADAFFEEQKKYLEDFWRTSSITIESEDGSNEAVHYNTYQLLASAGKDGISNVSAKGLSGEGYEGHYFWDTEIYILPFFTVTQPALAKKILLFRYSCLNNARQRAIELGHHQGAKIPWRTINGDECSGYFPAGCAQYHINADVAYAYIQYFLMTQDEQFMLEYGFEVILETARIWTDMGHYVNGKFRIDTVTGPDEYSAIVNNNYYTNSMAKYHLAFVIYFNEILSKRYTTEFTSLKQRLRLTEAEIKDMFLASDRMYLPFDEEQQLCLQDDSFANKAEWDFENEPKDKHPLLLYYHPMTIYRHKVLKQADTVLAHFLLDNVSDTILKNTYNYYEKRTTHDSSLSPCVHGIMATRINDVDKAYDFFMKTLRLDLDNLHHNTKDGLHIANLGGVYMSVVYGFGGLRIKPEGVFIEPKLPKQWKAFSFQVLYQGCLVRIQVTQDDVTLISEGELELYVYGVCYKLKEGSTIISMNLSHK